MVSVTPKGGFKSFWSGKEDEAKKTAKDDFLLEVARAPSYLHEREWLDLLMEDVVNPESSNPIETRVMKLYRAATGAATRTGPRDDPYLAELGMIFDEKFWRYWMPRYETLKAKEKLYKELQKEDEQSLKELAKLRLELTLYAYRGGHFSVIMMGATLVKLGYGKEDRPKNVTAVFQLAPQVPAPAASQKPGGPTT